MSDTGPALFRAMCERPWDTGPRLRYADWLEQNGQAQWAAFVRYQCENPDQHLSPFAAHYMFELFDEVGQFDPYESDWLKKLPELPGVSWWGSGFKAGFVHEVAFRGGAAFREHAEAVFASTPIDSVSLEGQTPESLRDVLASPLLSRLDCLSLFGGYGDEGMHLLAGCPHLTRLTRLFVMEDGCGDDGAEALAASPYLGNLQHLYMENHQIGDRGALALARSMNLGGVTTLCFGETNRLSRSVVDTLKRRFAYLDGCPTGS
jgi:uncharacterized protein (TIGR02996 family)